MPMDLAIIDYGMGNLRSVQKALEQAGAKAGIIDNPSRLVAPGLVLPGVGAFKDAMDRLRSRKLIEPIMEHVAADKPFLGICLGLHLLLNFSEEFGTHRGLGIVPGRVVRFSTGKKIPHMGWNTISIAKKESLLEGIPDNSYVYFVHSFYPIVEGGAWVGATTEYGEVFPSVISHKRIFATQFHPEKSQKVGLRMLKNFVQVVRSSS